MTIKKRRRPQGASTPEERDAKAARALRLRIALNRNEQREAEALRQQAYQFADDKLDEIDELASQELLLQTALWRIEQRQNHAAFKRRHGQGVAA